MYETIMCYSCLTSRWAEARRILDIRGHSLRRLGLGCWARSRQDIWLGRSNSEEKPISVVGLVVQEFVRFVRLHNGLLFHLRRRPLGRSRAVRMKSNIATWPRDNSCVAINCSALSKRTILCPHLFLNSFSQAPLSVSLRKRSDSFVSVLS